MCGRYTQKLKSDDLVAAMSARDETGGAIRENTNVAPTSTMPIVVAEQPSDTGADTDTDTGADTDADTGADTDAGADAAAVGERVLRLATWGLVPSWAKDRSIGARMINARAETVAVKPAFRSAYAARRCLVPATGFYEWFRPGGGARRGQPFYMYPAGHPATGDILAFAGLYEVWRKGDEPLATFTILTTTAAEGLSFLHDRSPVILPVAAWDRWIDPATDPADLTALLRPAPAGVLLAHPVGTAVGNVRNKGAELTDQVELDEAVTEAIEESGGPRATALSAGVVIGG
ncbi:SOS response-associated peptidase [Frankia sp. Ag45/Mut15]|uniref:Abasic site processing protein n=1 Tax=Frankia umida TaxID=573489 RepID=A0ABT0JY01_9ACTN|nr:SOS response-associated peptidase [Frankia umida]MCK9876422.1 SOS response-associated peptidase [Frankia umida]